MNRVVFQSVTSRAGISDLEVVARTGDLKVLAVDRGLLGRKVALNGRLAGDVTRVTLRTLGRLTDRGW